MDSDPKDISTLIQRVETTHCPHCSDDIHVGQLEPFSEAECPHCGKTLTVPAKLGPFLLVGVIGTGGMGGVYRAVDESLGRSVAIKVMLSSLGDDEDFVETFRREAQAAAKLNHPHIAQIYSFGQEKGQPYIVMELVTGRGLDKMIEEGEPLDQGLVMQVALDISEGLNEADQIGLQHGDIKPENILLNEKMDAKLIDFGIASYGGKDASEGIWGTPYYIAPEKLRRQTVDARSDIYSLGATLYHALSGHPPFEGETPIEVVKARLEREPAPLSELREDINPDIERIIARMLRMDPADRYPTYTSLISDMRKVAGTVKPQRDAGLKAKKIRIRKKTSGKITVPGGSSTTTGSRSTVKTQSGQGAEKKKPTEEDKRRRKALKRRLIGGSAVLILVVAGIATGLILKARHEREISRRRYYLALTSARENAQSAHATVQQTVSNIVKRTEELDPILNQVSEAVEVVTQASPADLREWLTERSPVFDPARVDADEGDEEKTAEDDETAASSEAANAGAGEDAAAEAADAEAEAASTNAPAGAAAGSTNAAAGASEDTNGVAQAEASAEEDAAPADRAGSDDVSDAEDEQDEAPEAPVVPENEPEIRILARDVLEQILKVRTAVVKARETGVRATRLWDEARESNTPSVVEARAATLNEMVEALETTRGRIREYIDRAESIVKRMTLIKTRRLRQRAAEERERIEREKALAEQREREQREAQRRARVEAEIGRVRTAAAEVEPLLASHQYRKASRSLRDKVGGLETEEGQAELQVYLDRYDYLYNLRMFFVEQLNEDPFKWGWIQGQSPEDILGANIGFVKLRGRAIPWEDVTTRQMVHLIRHYITRANQSVSLSDLGKHALAAAIFAYENGGYRWAADYKEQAVQFSPRLRDEAARLVPDEPPEGAGEQGD